jgi:RNA polymerase sigma factor (TIGR02999 family)
VDHETGEGGEITRLLHRSAGGSDEAFQRLIALVYADLKAIAHRRLGNPERDPTLDTTSLVHEAFLRLVPGSDADWKDRAHFFAVAARAIRHVLVDHARARAAAKRGGGAVHIPLREDLEGHGDDTVTLLALHQALDRLEEKDERLGRVVECRFFAGLTMEETAEALGVSRRTAERDWTRARAYLYRTLRS